MPDPVRLGQLSQDRQSYWDGSAWQSATSPDGAYRWDGQQWVPAIHRFGIGQLSEDRQSYWDGSTWRSVVSPNGAYQWDGRQWVPRSSTPTPPYPAAVQQAPPQSFETEVKKYASASRMAKDVKRMSRRGWRVVGQTDASKTGIFDRAHWWGGQVRFVVIYQRGP